jgi:outer membrane usher protein
MTAVISQSLLFRRSPLALALLVALNSASAAASTQNYFNPAFLSSDKEAVADLSRFENGGSQAPGTYRVDVYLNEKFVALQDVSFVARENAAAPPTTDEADASGLQPCFTTKALDALGVNISAFPKLALLPADDCVDLAMTISHAMTHFDFERQRLDISIPQAALKNDARGYIAPDQWDQGINALLLNYNFTGANSSDRSETGHNSSNNYFLGLNSGANFGPWRLRDFSAWNHSGGGNNGSTSAWQHVNTYVERSLIGLKSELTVGESSTPAEVFDSLNFRGVQMASDDNMMPDSLKGFAPTVRGVARSNAQVTIKQSGYTIYQSYVPPGAFVINDLYPTSSSGDLHVSVTEADGSVSSFTLPYSAVPILQRDGRLKYSATVGKYRSNGDTQDDVGFVQGTVIQGVMHGITLYGGTQLADKYRAIALGSGVNLGDLGAISVDATQAQSTLVDDSQHTGQSYRFLYAKSLNSLGTNFQLMGYRYSTSGFYTFADTTYKTMSGNPATQTPDKDPEKPDWTNYYNLYYSRRGKIQLNITQQIGQYGSIFVAGSQQSYWHTGRKDSLLQVGYNTTVNDISYSLTYNYNKVVGQPSADQIFAFNISVPLSKLLSPGTDMTRQNHRVYSTYNISTDNHGNTTQNGGVSGTLLEANNLSYVIQQGCGNHGVGGSGNASVSYQGAYGNANAGYNYSSSGDYQQVNYGLSGGVVAHADGITLSQPLGDTNVLVASPGASDVALENSPGLRTDWRGYAVVPYASPYRQNRIALNTNTLKNNVDINDAVTNVVPTQGALVQARFQALVGVRALITLLHHQKPVPFGAMVKLALSNVSGMVGDDGVVYLSGLPEQGTLEIKWSEASAQRCTVNYVLPKDAKDQAITRMKHECQ